jgi:hypothetical protein
MRFLRLLGLLATLFYFPFVMSDAANLPPDPSRLGASWWDYFVTTDEDGPEVLALQIDAASERLAALKAQLILDNQTSLAALTDTVMSNLRRYQKFSSEPLPVPPMARAAQETYTLTEIGVDTH